MVGVDMLGSSLIVRGLTRLRREAFRRSASGVVGGFLGLCSLFLNWYYVPTPWHFPNIIFQTQTSIFRPIWDGPWFTGLELIGHGWNGLGAGVLIFAVGSLIALFWRLGFVVQASGLLMFLSDFRAVQAHIPPSLPYQPELLSDLTSGYVVALAAFLIVAFGGIATIWSRAVPTVTPSISRIATHSPNAIRLKR